jgi:hypothetical protein
MAIQRIGDLFAPKSRALEFEANFADVKGARRCGRQAVRSCRLRIESRSAIPDLRAGIEFFLQDSIEAVSARAGLGRKIIVLTPDTASIRCCVPAQVLHDTCARRTALQQKSGHDAQSFAVEASQVCRRSTAMLRCRMDSSPVTPGCCGGATFAGN